MLHQYKEQLQTQGCFSALSQHSIGQPVSQESVKNLKTFPRRKPFISGVMRGEGPPQVTHTRGGDVHSDQNC